VPSNPAAASLLAVPGSLTVHELPQLFQGAEGHAPVHAGGAAGIGVMNEDNMAVPRLVDVKFNGIGTLPPRQSQRRDRVLRSVRGGAPVGDDLKRGSGGHPGPEQNREQKEQGFHERRAGTKPVIPERSFAMQGFTGEILRY